MFGIFYAGSEEHNYGKETDFISPPDITEAEVSAVADALRSGWITTGPRTKEFEKMDC